MTIAAILPCRGRHEQTIANVKRLRDTAGAPFQLIAVGGKPDFALLDQLAAMDVYVLRSDVERVTYWQALAGATAQTEATHLINLANDLLPGQHWLRRAVEAYAGTFRGLSGLLGFNGDSHEVGHSCHFLIARSLLDRYGGWPVWYDHSYGDTELCQRAIGDGLYAKSAWALLYHDHPYWGGQDDAVYQEGRALVDRDAALYEQRRRAGWPAVPAANGGRPAADTAGARVVARSAESGAPVGARRT
jgi:hypothetical protein